MGAHYVLNGQKTWVTNGGPAEWYIVFALTDPDKRTRGGISAFLVGRDTPGVTLGKPMKKMGLRASATVDLFLDNVRVPADRLLGAEGEAFRYGMKTFEASRPQIATSPSRAHRAAGWRRAAAGPSGCCAGPSTIPARAPRGRGAARG